MAVPEIDASYALLSYYARLESEIMRDRPQDAGLLRQETNPPLLQGSKNGIFAVQELLGPDQHVVFSAPWVLRAVPTIKEPYTVSDSLSENELARINIINRAEYPYRVLEQNVRTIKDERSEHIANALDMVAYYAGIEAEITHDRPKDAARLRQNGNFSLLPGSGHNYGSILDVRPLVEPAMNHVLYAAVQTRSALEKETGNREINLTRGDFQEIPVSGHTVTYPSDSLIIRRKVRDITTMLGATNRRLMSEPDLLSGRSVYHYDTNIGLTLIETVTNNDSGDGVRGITLFARKTEQAPIRPPKIKAA